MPRAAHASGGASGAAAGGGGPTTGPPPSEAAQHNLSLPEEKDPVTPVFPTFDEVPPRPSPGGPGSPLLPDPDHVQRHIPRKDLPEGKVRAGNVVIGGHEDRRGEFSLSHGGLRGKGVLQRVLRPPLHVDAGEDLGRKGQGGGQDAGNGEVPPRPEKEQFPPGSRGPRAVPLLDPALPPRDDEDRVRGTGRGGAGPLGEDGGG